MILFFPASFLYFWASDELNIITGFFAVYFSLIGFIAYLVALKMAKRIQFYPLMGTAIFFFSSLVIILWRAWAANFTLRQDGHDIFINGIITGYGLYAQLLDHLPSIIMFNAIVVLYLWRTGRLFVRKT